ncbi:aromatic amino acid transaminase [Tumebacillus sp. DT12]|uniref:Aromatic amino acid transaminase n=1 Tax=Tumebacillus lacus TaxID=2995335 RepID=A0ABT3X392_9BACL|nr:aromatic amino acid transaminase [Tumebacillus lacus]MCX7570911.1 aromatic amino acid transaminase [Tumebacillus lacus]
MQTLIKTSIMQLLELYRQDPRADKLNLTAGIYMDESGTCPILDSVREAEAFRVQNQSSKATFNLTGAPDYQQAVRTLLFPNMGGSGETHHVQVIQTLGASGALHLVGKLVNHYTPNAKIWLSAPTWENHPAVLNSHAGGFGHYRYLPAHLDEVSLDTILADLESAKPGDYVLLHACCHNPTGMDLNLSQWTKMADFCAERHLIPLFDFAYQGFAHSPERDAELFDAFKERVDRFLICNSFSKNMGLYDERIGALTLVFKEEEQALDWNNTAKRLIRSSYSMPPTHGSFIVSHILNDPDRCARWQQELAGMCNDLHTRRAAFFTELANAGIQDQVLTYRQQQGMFVMLNLSEQQIDTLRERSGIYLLGNGRISIASLRTEMMPRFVEALKSVI